MKAYVIITGALFGVLAVAHLLRMVTEDRHLAADPVYILITAATAALCLWAAYVLWRSSR